MEEGDEGGVQEAVPEKLQVFLTPLQAFSRRGRGLFVGTVDLVQSLTTRRQGAAGQASISQGLPSMLCAVLAASLPTLAVSSCAYDSSRYLHSSDPDLVACG